MSDVPNPVEDAEFLRYIAGRLDMSCSQTPTSERLRLIADRLLAVTENAPECTRVSPHELGFWKCRKRVGHYGYHSNEHHSVTRVKWNDAGEGWEW